MRTFVFVAIVVCGSTAGDIALSHAMKQIGGVEALRPAALWRAFSRAVRLGWTWAAIGLMTVGFFSLLAALSWADVTVVVPATALSYGVSAVGAKYLLHEDVAPVRWAGVLLVCLGVALVSLS